MENTILSPVAPEVPSVIRFLQAEGNGAAQIQIRRLCAVYRNTMMNDGSVSEWCRQFKNGRTSVHNEGGDQGRTSIMTEDVVHPS